MAKTVNISIRLPVEFLPKMPAPGNGRSEFIVSALADKFAALAASGDGWETHAARRASRKVKPLPFNAVARSREEGGER